MLKQGNTPGILFLPPCSSLPDTIAGFHDPQGV